MPLQRLHFYCLFCRALFCNKSVSIQKSIHPSVHPSIHTSIFSACSTSVFSSRPTRGIQIPQTTLFSFLGSQGDRRPDAIPFILSWRYSGKCLEKFRNELSWRHSDKISVPFGMLANSYNSPHWIFELLAPEVSRTQRNLV